MNNSDNGAFGAGMAAFFILYFIFVVALLALGVWMQWRILVKAGYSGWLSLLILTGIGGLVVQLILAFGRWPIEDQLEAALAGRPPAPSNAPFAGPPATY